MFSIVTASLLIISPTRIDYMVEKKTRKNKKKTVQFRYDLIKVCFFGCHLWEVNNALNNGLALNRQQAINLTNDDRFQWCMYAALVAII